MLGIYLGSCKAKHLNYNLIYNDIEPKYKPDLLCSMLDVDLSKYDYYICTPPCNFWSKANPYYLTSEYALKTKDLLPLMLEKLSKLHKPFIIENVKNFKRMKDYHIFDICNKNGIFYQSVGRHIYFTNQLINLNCSQTFDFKIHGKRLKNYVQGGDNVHKVIEIFLRSINATNN